MWRRFRDALAPIDSLLEEASQKETSIEKTVSEEPKTESNHWATEALKNPEPEETIPDEAKSEDHTFTPPYEENDFIPAPSVTREDPKKDLPESLPKPDSNPYF